MFELSMLSLIGLFFAGYSYRRMRANRQSAEERVREEHEELLNRVPFDEAAFCVVITGWVREMRGGRHHPWLLLRAFAEHVEPTRDGGSVIDVPRDLCTGTWLYGPMHAAGAIVRNADGDVPAVRITILDVLPRRIRWILVKRADEMERCWMRARTQKRLDDAAPAEAEA